MVGHQLSDYELNNTYLEIWRYWRVKGYTPTYQELADRMGFHKSTARFRVHRLVELGKLELLPNKVRAIRLLEKVT